MTSVEMCKTASLHFSFILSAGSFSQLKIDFLYASLPERCCSFTDRIWLISTALPLLSVQKNKRYFNNSLGVLCHGFAWQPAVDESKFPRFFAYVCCWGDDDDFLRVFAIPLWVKYLHMRKSMFLLVAKMTITNESQKLLRSCRGRGKKLGEEIVIFLRRVLCCHKHSQSWEIHIFRLILVISIRFAQHEWITSQNAHKWIDWEEHKKVIIVKIYWFNERERVFLYIFSISLLIHSPMPLSISHCVYAKLPKMMMMR